MVMGTKLSIQETLIDQYNKLSIAEHSHSKLSIRQNRIRGHITHTTENQLLAEEASC